jgi:hypothetical protein
VGRGHAGAVRLRSRSRGLGVGPAAHPAFLEQRTTLEALEAEPNRTQWFDVVADAHADT